MTPTPRRLSDLPTSRLLAMLRDVERAIGRDSQTARTLARVVRDRVAAECSRERDTTHADR